MPALKAGRVVICDRFEDSTLAYQGFGRKISLKTIASVSRELVRGTVVPNLTFLLDIPPSVGLRRGGRHDRIERQSLEFHHRVWRGFLKLAKKEPRRMKVLDARRSKESVTREIEKILNRRLR
jgi:dTMP kinase